ncbi:MAG TPA: imidazole glycerol phosphate synthase cyclase subunit, partial [Anaerolineae bacterium]|nr:imidazole glycerol phosphate synthase cyclase subunit [Anaerolineae bacterium]
LNTAAVANPEIITECAEKFGSQCVVVAVDAKREANGQWQVYTHGGRRASEREAIEWAQEIERRGAGEILLTSIDRDGTHKGYDLDLTRAITEVVNIPVIASGGAGHLEHFYEALTLGGADAVLAASLFHDRVMSIEQVKSYLAERGVRMRQ